MKSFHLVVCALILTLISLSGWKALYPDSKSKLTKMGFHRSVITQESATLDRRVARNTLYDRIVVAELESCGPLLNEISLIEDVKLRRKLCAVLVERWIEHNPEDFKSFLAALAQGSEVAQRFLPILGQSFVDLGGKVNESFFYPLASSYSAVNFKDAVSWSGDVVNTGRDVFPCVEIFGTLTTKNLTEAVGQALALHVNPVRTLVMEHLAYNWDKNDFNGAMAFVERLPENEKANFIREYFRALTYSDTAKAGAILNATTDPLILQSAVASVGETSYYTSGATKAMAWVDTLPTPEVRWVAVEAIYGAWGSADPLAAVTDAQSRYPQNPDLAGKFFGSAVTGRNDEDIMQTLAQLESPDWQSYAYLGAFERMTQFESPQNMERLLKFASGDSLDRALSALVSVTSDNAPDLAAKWAKQIHDPKLSATILAEIAAGKTLEH